MAKFQAVWAIDIGQSALKALKLVPGETPEQLVAEAFDFIEYPKILSQPDADAEELVRDALQTFLGRNDLKGTRVGIAVPGQAGLVKFIKLPPVEKKRIPDIVKFEARQQIPFALEEVIWDYQQIAGDEEEGGDDSFTMAEVGLFAMKRDQIYRAIQPLKNANIEVDVVQMSPLALFNFAAFDQVAKLRSGEETGSIVLLDIGADNTDLIITDGTRIWQRNVPIGGNHFTRALTKELKLTFAKAEHLKRNATKSQDPRAVFTAMRGVFNDFSSEVGRSIGFYSSVNRQAKILRVIGLGNGFKLPGLQKFLQQNLNYEVERLEGFDRLVGEEVAASPQFVENLMSFAVPYGLGVQGLGLGRLHTNLLPPEIEQVRMIRRKKPWALVASALLLVGFSALYLGDWNAWGKAVNPEMDAAVQRAKSVAQQGSQLKSAFDSAKGAFSTKKTQGEALVAETSELASWPALLTAVNAAVPDPVKILEATGNDPEMPENQEILRDLRIHIDAILPRYVMDLGTEWFNSSYVSEFSRDSMHPYDRANPPSGEGWVIQLIGHHYNPSPVGANAKNLTDREKVIAFGPIPYLTDHVLPRFWTPEIRQFGIHHAALTYASIDPQWVSASTPGGGTHPAPQIPRPTGGGGGMMGGPGMMGGQMGAMMSRMGGMSGGMSGGMAGGAMMGPRAGMMAGKSAGGGGMQDMMQSMAMARSYMGRGAMLGADPKSKVEETTLTRTDFAIHFIWTPSEPGKEPPALEEITKNLVEAQEKAKNAPKALSEEALLKSSQEMMEKAFNLQVKAITGATQAAPDAKAAPAADAKAAPESGQPAPEPGQPAPDAKAAPPGR
jgi:type IV pilus assembly protein PilM